MNLKSIIVLILLYFFGFGALFAMTTNTTKTGYCHSASLHKTFQCPQKSKSCDCTKACADATSAEASYKAIEWNQAHTLCKTPLGAEIKHFKKRLSKNPHNLPEE